MFPNTELSVLINFRTPEYSFIFSILSFILLRLSIAFISWIAISESFIPCTTQTKLVVLPAFSRVDAPPSWDLILKPSSGVVPVLWSCITILISLLTDDLALIDWHLKELIKHSISGIENVELDADLILESRRIACSLKTEIGNLNSSSFPLITTISLSYPNS